MQKTFATTLLGMLLVLLPLRAPQALDTTLPQLGSSADSIISPRQERELGRAFVRSVRQSESVLGDPLVVDYIHTLGASLVQHSGHADRHFDFFVVANNEVNAFAGPDGYIGVYSGLVLTTETESELAAVLAHEIAHDFNKLSIAAKVHYIVSWRGKRTIKQVQKVAKEYGWDVSTEDIESVLSFLKGLELVTTDEPDDIPF